MRPGAFKIACLSQNHFPCVCWLLLRLGLWVQVDFDEFLLALSKVADKKGQSLVEVARGILLAGGPTVNSTKANYIKFHDDKVPPPALLPPILLPSCARSPRFSTASWGLASAAASMLTLPCNESDIQSLLQLGR